MTDLSKDEVIAMAREAGVYDVDIFKRDEFEQSLERFATLARAPLVAEVERLIGYITQANLDMTAVMAENDALKAELERMKAVEPVEPVAYHMLECTVVPRPLAYPLHDYHFAPTEGPLHFTWVDKPHRLLYDLIAAVRHYAKPQPSAVPVVQTLVEAVHYYKNVAPDVRCFTSYNGVNEQRADAALAAGQQFLKESNHG